MGGTFDPIHNGHLSAATELLAAAGLDQVWMMPNARPPHRREPRAGAEDRMRMVELALAGRSRLYPSRLEVDRGGISYTIESWRELHRRFPMEKFALLLGADAAQHIRGWHDAEAVLREASFVIFNRPGTSLTDEAIAELGFPPARTRSVHLETPDVAAHEIRERLVQGLPIDDLVPASVARYIREHGLYGPSRTEKQLG
jgi:nicotinate-nucleotide adenylyltransferase